jgi:hypothetical protein
MLVPLRRVNTDTGTTPAPHGTTGTGTGPATRWHWAVGARHRCTPQALAALRLSRRLKRT